MTRLIKKNYKLFLSVLVLILISTVNTIEGYVFCKYGFGISLFLLEITSIVLSILLLNILWCVFDDGKCSTVKK